MVSLLSKGVVVSRLVVSCLDTGLRYGDNRMGHPEKKETAMEDKLSILSEVIGKAGRAVLDAEIPNALQAHAFERALDVLMADAGLMESKNMRLTPIESSTVAASQTLVQENPDDPLGRIAKRAAISEQEAKEVFRLDGDQLSLVVANKKIDASKATGAREITLLVAGGRQAAAFEDWTRLSHAREICARYNRLDPKNYAATVKSMADVFTVHGQGTSREVRLTMPGWEQWAQMIQNLVRGS